MKIDKRKPAHWIYLATSGVLVLTALALRALSRRRPGSPYRVLLYGHKLNGNLLAIYRAITTSHSDAFDVSVLSLDPTHARELKRQGVAAVALTGVRSVPKLAAADAIITDHGLHSLYPLLRLSSIRFFDVWHGIPFKGFEARDFRVLHHYDEAWLASPLMADLYVNRFGFETRRVQVTGYARTDRLICPPESPETIKQRLGLPADSKVLLFAPTWRQDRKSRTIYPFDADPREFLDGLAALSENTRAVCVVRTHLNTPVDEIDNGACPPLIHLPSREYPDTEEILQVADVLICDWSSIAFDFLLLDRPTIFLNVPAPFAKGFSLGPEYRFGAVAESMREMLQMAERFVTEPSSYHDVYGERAAAIRERVYGRYADGQSAERCIARLVKHLDAVASHR